jgi:hypothetical protein
MTASIVLSPRAERSRTELPPRIRKEINKAIRRIAAAPDWGAVIQDGEPPPLRLIAPARSPNTGLIADMSVSDGAQTYAIVYRVRDHGREVWIEDIRQVFLG